MRNSPSIETLVEIRSPTINLSIEQSSIEPYATVLSLLAKQFNTFPMDLKLSNTSAIVTGGASGIGLAIANCFAAEGTRVAILDLSPQTNDRADEIRTRYNIPCFGIPTDVTDESSVMKSVASAVELLDGLDHVVHCAAMGSGKFGFPFTNMRPSDWQRTLHANVMGMVHLAYAVTPTLVDAKKGSVCIIGSVAGQIGSQTDPPYSASKAANINFAQCLAKDLAPHNIRVNTVCPGMVQTPLNRSVWQAWFDQTPEAERLDYEVWADRKIRSVVPLQRWQTPEDIANMVVFLASERAGHVTGQTINVDGGFVMHW